MTRQELIFSSQPKQKAGRHLLFWTLYCLYFWMQSINPWGVENFTQINTYKFAFYSLCCFVPTCILTTYITIYFLLPAFLEKRKYLQFFAGLISLFLTALLINYYTADIFIVNAKYVIPSGYEFHKQLGLGETNTKWAITISLIAIGIKLSKNWYLQEKENLEISRKKTRTTLQLQKARVNPDLLFNSLQSIRQKIVSGSEDSSFALLKLSDLLSYSLYESDTDWVLFDKEIAAIHDFIYLKNSTTETRTNIQIKTKSDTEHLFIAPILLPMLQDISGCTSNKDVEIRVLFHPILEEKKLIVKIKFAIPVDRINWESEFSIITEKVRNRLLSLNDQHNLVIRETETEKIILLNLSLAFLPKMSATVSHQTTIHDPT